MWKPIETAPKDGTPIIVVGGHIESAGPDSVPLIARWDYNRWEAVHYCYEQPITKDPTHWMELPGLPTEYKGE